MNPRDFIYVAPDGVTYEMNRHTARPWWKSEKEYLEISSKSYAQIAWEFLRRNPDYFRDYHELKWIIGTKLTTDINDAKEIRSILDYEDRLARKLANKYGLDPEYYPPSPTSSRFCPLFAKQTVTNNDQRVRFIDDNRGNQSENAGKINDFIAPSSMIGGTITVTDNIISYGRGDELLVSEIDSRGIRNFITARGRNWPRRRGESSERKAHRRRQIIIYLRIIDAKSCGASSSDIRTWISCYHGIPREAAQGALDNHWRAAKRMLASGYLKLAASD